MTSDSGVVVADSLPCFVCREPAARATEMSVAGGGVRVVFEPCGHRLRAAGPFLQGWRRLHAVALPLSAEQRAAFEWPS